MFDAKRHIKIAVVAAVITAPSPLFAQAEHACDALGDAKWNTVPTVEVVDQADSAPYRSGGNWFVDRTTVVLPFCNYYNSLGNYSLRSYTLSPEVRKERVEICHGGSQGGSAAVAPYAGQCPPT